MPRLQIRNAKKAYGVTHALRQADFELEPGEVHVLIGANGCGKSTLCKIIAGSVKPDSGELLIDGKSISVSGPQSSRALGVGIFYQELSLSKRRSVAENICLADLPVQAGFFLNRNKLLQTAQTYMKLFDGVTGKGFSADTLISELRADQQQLTEIMKTLASEAPVLIFDEPTSALDRAQTERFFDILRQLKAQGRSMIFISHRMDEIFAIGDRVTVMREGKTVSTSRISDVKPADLIHDMVGNRENLAISGHAPALCNWTGAPLLSVESFSGTGFHDISFDVHKGEIVGFGGLHGQGQSAVLRALFGATRHVQGIINLNQKLVMSSNPRNAIEQGFAYISGDRVRQGIFQGRPILENVPPVHFIKQNLKMARPQQLIRNAAHALESLKTKYQTPFHPIDSLSGGNQQKVVIARWLMDRPDILLLDDPTKGIDLETKTDLFTLIRQLAEEGMGIILYSSEDAELINNSDKIAVFNGGTITRLLTGNDRNRFNLYEAAYEVKS